MNKKYYCPACGYTSDEPIDICPRCGAKMKVREEGGEKAWAAEHIVGVAKDVDPEIIQGLRDNFNGECSEVGMYLAMARVAHREGYPEIGLYWEKAAHEEAEHAAKFAELLGEVLTDSTKTRLATAEHLKASSRDTSANNRIESQYQTASENSEAVFYISIIIFGKSKATPCFPA